MKKKIRTQRIQGIVLILLAFAAHKTGADGAIIFFAIIGIAMLDLDLRFIPRSIYLLAKRVVRYGNRKEWYA